MPSRPVSAVAAAIAAATLLAGCGGSHATPPTLRDTQARGLLVRALDATRALGRQGACTGCYPSDASEITEDLYLRTGDQYAAAASASQVRFGDVVYLDTTGRSSLTARHITFYVRAHNGSVWRLDANGGAPRISPAG
jgi:hypothetical protein